MGIAFNVKNVSEYLISHGFVYTLRAWDKDYESEETLWINGKQVGKCQVVPVYKINFDYDLIPYEGSSGFTDYKEWYKLANRLHKGKDLILYKVSIIGKLVSQ